MGAFKQSSDKKIEKTEAKVEKTEAKDTTKVEKVEKVEAKAEKKAEIKSWKSMLEAEYSRLYDDSKIEYDRGGNAMRESLVNIGKQPLLAKYYRKYQDEK